MHSLMLLVAALQSSPSPAGDGGRVWTAADFPAPVRTGQPLRPGERAPFTYPVEALRRREQGRTVAIVRVGTDGRAIRCSIGQSSGSPTLDKETCRIALQNAHYRPATDGPVAVESDVPVPVTWRLPR